MAVTSRNELIEYCLRQLGAPVLEVNVDDDQVADRVDEALQYYQTYHSDALLDSYYKIQVTAADITNEYITLPADISVITRIVPLNGLGFGGGGGIFNVEYQMAFNDVYNLRSGGFSGMAQYAQMQSQLTLAQGMFNTASQVRFSRHMSRLYLYIEWGKDIVADDYIVLDASVIIDPETYVAVYNDMFLKKYTTQLIKRQWGTNLKKFEGMQLPGGVTMSGQIMWEEANAEIQSLEEQMQLNWEFPPDFMIG
jgi:hypothetical protein|tara:strand:+ start:503 stop:1258 length:756 start_codon:yes stop_codon:yes gene_type:complete